jgi:hypothetical protein
MRRLFIPLLVIVNCVISSHASSPRFVLDRSVDVKSNYDVDVINSANKDFIEYQKSVLILTEVLSLRGGDGILPAGWHPFGYAITSLGVEFLKFDGSLDCDVGRFVASLKASRKTKATIKETWLEIVRVSKTGQSMRIYRQLDDIITFCLKAGLID